MTEPDIQIKYLGGYCPVQAEGTIDGKPFYFRARGEHWSIGIGGEPIGDPDWYYEQDYGDGAFDASWMEHSEALNFIKEAAAGYRARVED